MMKKYDKVRIKKTGAVGAIIEIDDDNGKKPPIYLIEIIDKPASAKIEDVVFWCNYDEIELV